ncbi:SMP-30/gluconolactonase/LRE family protein [Aquabacterium sp. A7-Y]|uniref:SMP-30/gluconolactonase/LRE family protein n=1 Tax=Aquabacterium sp. A7-Y TaxID=1349605 RepID=UPI00223D1933|nr:SMP-30/gluconolactonase/LRE family protein [Aquabacterium sp. A7-Y]MCW7538334.1 SMP-30/gluconolactonase/LRE family protein [Aquabacterium sp. A7-Y]
MSPAAPAAHAAAHIPQLHSDLLAVWRARAVLGDGLCWSPRRQALYWVDVLAQRLYRYTPATGHRERWYFYEPISAVAECRSERLLLVALGRSLALFDPEANDGYGQVQPLRGAVTEAPGKPFCDGGCDPQGRFWAGTAEAGQSGRSALYRCDGEGRCARLLGGDSALAHGISWSPDGGTVYLNDGTSCICAFDFDAARGQLDKRRDWLRFDAADGQPRGMSVDADGRLWVARWGGGCVSCHAPDDGRELMRVQLPVRQVSDVAFGGAQLRTLYVTTARWGLTPEQQREQPLAGALFAVQTDIPGQAPCCFAP